MSNSFSSFRFKRSGIFIIVSTFLSSFSFANTPYVPLFSSADMGVARAGSAASAQDASTNYTNPAGIMRFSRPNLTVVGNGSITPSRFDGTVTIPGFGTPTYTETGGASTRSQGVVPAIYYTYPISNRWATGVALTVPYAFGVQYPTDSVVRYEIIYGRQLSLDIGPNIAYRFNSQWSVGLGPDLLYYYAQSKAAIRTQPYTTTDSFTTNHTSDIRPGFHVGILYEITPDSRIGFSYHSQIITHLTGVSTLYMGDNSLINPSVTHTTNFGITLPLAGVATLSAVHKITPRWTVLGTLEYMNWGVYRNDHVYNAPTPIGVIDAVSPRNFHDTMTYALGTTYQYNDKWLLRAGANYYPNNVSGSDRDITFTNAANITVACGARYQVDREINIDINYSHGFTYDADINHTYLGGSTIIGKKTTYNNTLGMQLNYEFV